MENNWKFTHLGVVVRDMEKSVKYFQSIGADVSQPARVHPVSKNILRFIKLGDLSIELVQPVEPPEGHTPARDFFNKRGQGMFHLGYHVKSYKKEEARMLETGATIVLSAKRPYAEVAYFEPPEAGANVIVELTEER